MKNKIDQSEWASLTYDEKASCSSKDKRKLLICFWNAVQYQKNNIIKASMTCDRENRHDSRNVNL